jgi:hypothetical protein
VSKVKGAVGRAGFPVLGRIERRPSRYVIYAVTGPLLRAKEDPMRMLSGRTVVVVVVLTRSIALLALTLLLSVKMPEACYLIYTD